LNQLGRQFTIPAAHQHDAAALEHRCVHATLHAGDMEERQHHQLTGIRIAAEPETVGERRMHHVAMRQHATLRPAGGAGAVRNHAQIFRSRGHRPWRSLRGQRVGPQSHIRIRDGLSRGADGVGHAQVGLRIDVVAIGRDDSVLELLAHQRLELRINVLGDQRDLRAAVFYVVLELRGDTHRIHRHYHCVRSQDAVVRQDELRAVLHD
jgi:hypothetical protein